MHRSAIVAFVVVVLSAIPGVFAQSDAPLKGWFSSKGAKFQVGGGVAFTGKSNLDGSTPVLFVVITNTRLNIPAVADFVDRRRAIEQLVKDDETPIVYLEFAQDGRWRGISYYFASGNGCAFCTSEVDSSVKFVKGRLAGKLEGSESDRPFSVAMDIPVLSDDHGAALPADGGAPGKAYLAYHAALVKNDTSAVRMLLSPGNLEMFVKAQKSNDLPSYMQFLTEKHPMKAVNIIRGWSTADKASLLIEGENRLGRLAGEVLLLNTKGVWGVDEELTDLVLGR
jgi:hypothetical protein